MVNILFIIKIKNTLIFKAFDIYFVNEEDNRTLPLYIKDTGVQNQGI